MSKAIDTINQSPLKELTWGLVIATYKREKILPVCLKLALEQTRKPCEVIIVDASPYWEETRNFILNSIGKDCPAVIWHYIKAKKASLTAQRNQGIQLATADVLFLIDDDSLMYPDCAEKIMEIYERDVEGKVKGVQGFSRVPPPSIPEISAIEEESRTGGVSSSTTKESIKALLKQKLKALKLYPSEKFNTFFSDHILLNKSEHIFVPYDGKIHMHKIPASIEELNIQPVSLMVGFKMTYRRRAISGDSFFEKSFLGYSALEDFDASYRVSRNGLLIESRDAWIHHYKGTSGILGDTNKLAITILNQAYLLRKHSQSNPKIILYFYFSVVRRLTAIFLKLLFTNASTSTNFKGIVLGVILASKILFLPKDNIQKKYSALQEKILGINN